ncbi:MAG TPA: NADH-quinone oxidoreductase subunit M [Candidimonas sp.]|nr:NADH-quinone oxidoreductase subunit M [Candidimonas sp.]
MASSTFPWLTLAIFVPIVAGLIVLLLGRDDRPGFTRVLALVGSVAGFLVTLPLYMGFNPNTADMQFVEKASWIKTFAVNYHLGVDGISLWFVLLTAFITIIVVLAGWQVITSRVAQYMASFLILSGLMVGVFASLDGMLFYVFFEATLIPMYLIIGVWGGPNRVYAAFKFFLYTLMGSLLTLIAFIYLWHASGGSFDIQTWHNLKLGYTPQIFIFVALLAAFAVKVPMWPVHTWLPDAHVEAPTGGSVVLAAVMLKVGTYGMLRFILPIVPDAGAHFAWLIIVLSLIAIVYIGYVALVQEDMKKLVAYSSVAHMGFVTLGIFIAFMLVREQGNTDMALLGMQGAMIQMISHGFVSGAMFTCIGVMYDRTHTRLIKDYGGVINVMPWFGFFYVLFAMANCGLPGTSGFVGEFMVILSSFSASPWIALFAAFTLVIGAAYTLWLVKRVLWGEITNPHVAEMKEINARETFVLGAFAAAVLALGIWPQPLVHLMDGSVAQLVQQLAIHKI